MVSGPNGLYGACHERAAMEDLVERQRTIVEMRLRHVIWLFIRPVEYWTFPDESCDMETSHVLRHRPLHRCHLVAELASMLFTGRRNG